jgi:hypothetical protein
MMARAIRNEYNVPRQNGIIPVLTMTILFALQSTRGIERSHYFAKCSRMIANKTSAEFTRMNGHMNKIARGSESVAEA